jgi:hypothetical protein
MPFDNPIPHAFSAASVRGYAPSVPGVFGISNSREWILIDQSDNIRESLSQYFNGSNPDVMKRMPTGFVYEACGANVQRARRDRLVAEYAPICNTGGGVRVGRYGSSSK